MRNTISGNNIYGIHLRKSHHNLIVNNNIGIGPNRKDKTINIGNGNWGIYFDVNSSNNIVKNSVVTPSKEGAIHSRPENKNEVWDPNSIYSNGYGIYNDSLEATPVLSSAVVSGTTITITGSLTHEPDAEYVLEFFGNDVAERQGKEFLGNLTVTTDEYGEASFNATLDTVYGNYVTATSTGLGDDGFTSEFSEDVAIDNLASTAAVGGRAWWDQNANGLQDEDEPDLAGADVDLYTAEDEFVASATTDSEGNYLFDDLDPDDYYLVFTPPTGYIFTRSYMGDPVYDSDADPDTGVTAVFTLTAGEVSNQFDAGFLPDDQPTAADDAYEIAHDQTLTVSSAEGVLVNDVDPLGNGLTASLVVSSGPENGTLTLNQDGSFTYEPDADFYGYDSFSYQAYDGASYSDPATVTIQVSNEAPWALGDGPYFVELDGTLNVPAAGVLENDFDWEDDELTVTLVDEPEHGDVTLNSDGSFTYTPDTSYEGEDLFTYTASDGVSDSELATVSIWVGNADPEAGDIGDLAFTEGEVTIDVLAYASDPNGDELTVSDVGETPDGTVTINQDDTITFTPDEGFAGVASFSYTVSDGNGGTATATVYVSVYDANGQWASSVRDFSSEWSTTAWSAEQALGAPDTFAYGDIVTAWAPLPINESEEYLELGFTTPVYATGLIVRETYGNGFLTQVDLIDTSDGYHTIWTGTDSTQPGAPRDFRLTFSATSYLVKGVKLYVDTDHDLDAWEEIDAVRILRAGTNTAPVATDDSDETVIDVPVTIAVLTNDSDANGDVLTITAVTQGDHGSVEIVGSSVVYTPDSGYEGTDSFSYIVSDGFGGTDTATVSVVIGQPQLAAGGPQAGAVVPLLSEANLQAAVAAALPQLSGVLGVSFDREVFGQVEFRITDLHGGILGITYQDTIWLDRDAAGHGWYLDVSATSDGSFGAAGQGQERVAHEGSAAAGRMDLLTVVAHELGHVLGFASVDAGTQPHHLMTATLAAGVRRLAAEPPLGTLPSSAAPTLAPALPVTTASSMAAPSLFSRDEPKVALALPLAPGWLFDRQTQPLWDDPGVAPAGLLLSYPEAASPVRDWEKPLPPLFPAETEALLPSAAAEPWGAELLAFDLWSSDDPELLVGGDGDDLRIGEEGRDFLIGGIGREPVNEPAEAVAASAG
jgi:hypothetical protein